MEQNDFDNDTDSDYEDELESDLMEDDFENFDNEDDSDQNDNNEANLGAGSFPEITKRFESIPHKFFADPNYYKTALSNEGDVAKRVNALLQKYVNCKDPKDRSVFRGQIISAFWEVLRSVARKAPGKISEPKRYLLRFNLLHPNLTDAETRNFFAKLICSSDLNQPVYYLDEWFKAVGTGVIRVSTSDEVKVAKTAGQMKVQQFLEKAIGKRDGAKTLLREKDLERNELEDSLKDLITVITDHSPQDGFEEINSAYSDSQRRTFSEIQETLKGLIRCDHDFNILLRDYNQAEADVNMLQEKIEDEGGEEILDLRSIDAEFDTIRQAAKMTIGRQGNHFPILSSEYFHSGPNDVGFRENVISLLAQIESIDPEVFCRYYKNKIHRIVPYIVLLPTYGDSGMCWEPFDKHNRATSRGRVMIPMYPKNLYAAVLSAVADLRWQVAKERASYYWMEEGLTGHYYQWFAAQKLKGDVKEFFIQDYILWMTKEAEGIQKLDKEVRGAFWRHMPFSKEIKEKLRNRSYVYQELCQRDKNREMSDGY